MEPFVKLAAVIAVPIIAFLGVRAILPYSWTHDEAGELSGFGFWLIFGILLGLAVVIQKIRDDQSRPPSD